MTTIVKTAFTFRARKNQDSTFKKKTENVFLKEMKIYQKQIEGLRAL